MKYHVEKSTTIAADKETVKKIVQDFNSWNSWSPWTVAEPNCKMEISGVAGESGHTMSWDGEIIGSGNNTLVSNEDGKLAYDLRFIKPFKSKAVTSFLFEEKNGETTVTWTMDSSMPFFLFFMVKTMKNWIGMDYKRGLRMLKEIVEKGSIQATTTNAGMTDVEAFSYVGIQRTVGFDDIAEKMPKDFDQLIQDIVVKQGKSAKHWLSLYPKVDMKAMTMTYIAAVSDEELKDVDLGDEYVRGTVNAGTALEIKHNGSYDFVGNAWSMGMMYIRAKKIKQRDIPFEQYWNSPKEVSPEELKTSVFFPVKST